MKMNGTIETIGITEPIPVGDNLEFDGIVYHIESVNHTCSISGNGQRIFRTQLSLSSGVSSDSGIKGVRYAEMDSTGAVQFLKEEHDSEPGVFPGISEAQDVVSRPTNLDLPVMANSSLTQPNRSSTKKGSQ